MESRGVQHLRLLEKDMAKALNAGLTIDRQQGEEEEGNLKKGEEELICQVERSLKTEKKG